MIFERPELLQYLPLVVLLLTASAVWQWRRSARLVEAFGGRSAARRLMGRTIGRFPGARLVCMAFATAAVTLAAAGARPDTGEPPPPPAPLDLIVAVDVSHSMTAADVEPSRAERAREVARAVLAEQVADRAALTLFAGWPYGLVPITDDLDVVDYFVPFVQPALVDQRHQGTALEALIEHATTTWQARPRDGGVAVLLIISDGEGQGTGPAAVASLDALVQSGVRVWTAGLGTEAGAPLFVRGSGSAPLLDGAGNQVVTAADFDVLRDLAGAGGGGFRDVGDDEGVDALIGDLHALRGGIEQSDQADFNPTALLLLIGLALLMADLILDSGAIARSVRTLRREEAWR